MKRRSLLTSLLFLSLAFSSVGRAQTASPDLPFGPLAPFTTDGCTGFPEGASQTDPHLWEHPAVAQIMYAGVRAGGDPWMDTSWRWGYGWQIIRGYSELTP